MNILITGATGTIGHQLTQALLERRPEGVEIRIGLRNPDKGTALVEKGAKVVPFDFEDEASVHAAFEGVDRAFLLSPFVEEFVPLVERAARAASAAGVEFVVRMSALGADPEAEEGLSRAHGLAEKAVRDHLSAWTVLRPTFFQDNVLVYQGDAVARGAFYGSSHQGRTAYVSSRDIAEVAATILLDPLAHQGKTYVLTGPEPISDEDVARGLSKVAGRQIHYVDLSEGQLLEGQLSAGTPRWMAEHLVALEGVKAAGWAAEVSPAVEQILRRPAEPFSAFVERHGARLR
jgi:uncharacterized protein YbjT (DUF2867 family)